MATLRQFQVTFDCAEPERVARFWCEVLGYVIPPPPDGFASWDEYDGVPPGEQGASSACVDPSGVGARLYFQRVPEGKVAKNRVHLDIQVERDRKAEEVARLTHLGAELIETHDTRGPLTYVLRDPEGNQFFVH